MVSVFSQRRLDSAGANDSAYGRPCSASSRSKHGSRRSCKVAFAREQLRNSSLHDQAHSAAESLVAKSHECVLQYQQHSHTPHAAVAVSQQRRHVTTRRSKHVTTTSSSSGGRPSWPWSFWSAASGSSSSSSSCSNTAAAAAAASSTVAIISTASYLLHTSSSVTSTSDGDSSNSSGIGSRSGSSWKESAAALITIQDTWDEERSIADNSSSSADTTQLFLHDVMPPAAAEAVAGEQVSTSSRLALLLGDTYPKAQTGSRADGAAFNGSIRAGASAGNVDVLDSRQQQGLAPRRHQRQQWGLGLRASAGASHMVPLPSTAALQRSLKSVGPQQQLRSDPNTGDSSSGSSASSRSSSSGEDPDWLTAVLSAPTSRLSSHSNTVLTNSLKRLATLRSTGGGLAASAAAVDGTEGLLDSIRARFDSFQLQQFEEVALQLAQLQYQPEAAWLTAFERASIAVMPGGSPRVISRLLLSRSKLPGPVSAQWCAACCQHMAAAPQKLSVSSWVNALYALVRLKHTPDRQFQATFFSATAERLDDISPELLTHLVWSLSRLQLSPPFLWWRSLVSATASIEKPFSQAQLASLVHSVALWAGPCGIAPQDVQRFVDMLLVEIHKHLGLLQPSELTMVVWSLGCLVSAQKLQPDAGLLDEIVQAIQGQLPRLSPQQCSSLCWGLAKLNHRLTDGFAEALLLEVQAQLAGFSSGNMCSVLWALAKLELVPMAPFRQQLWEELQHRIKHLGLPDLSTLLWALAQLQLQPPADILSELVQQSLVHLAACDATQLTNIVWALGRLGAQPDGEWLRAAESASMQVLPSANLSQVVNLAWGLSHMWYPSPEPSDTHSGGTAVHSPSHNISNSHIPSAAWQVACLRELRLRCVCAGVEVDCMQLVLMLQEMGVLALGGGAAAVADRLFEEQQEEACCSLQFQSGCR